MSGEANQPKPDSQITFAAVASLAVPVAMVLLACLLPKDDRPLHPADNRWYFQLTGAACFFSVLLSVFVFTRAKQSGRLALVLAGFGLAASLIIGFVALVLNAIHGMHT